LVAIFPRSSPRLNSLNASEASIRSVSWATSWVRVCASRSAASGLWQMTNRSVSLIRTPDQDRMQIFSTVFFKALRAALSASRGRLSLPHEAVGRDKC
jgi:hypothetical protein